MKGLLKCKQCGKDFEKIGIPSSFKKASFCSQRCVALYNATKGKQVRTIKQCIVCGKDFIAKRGNSLINKRRFCSKSCAITFRNSNNHPHPMEITILKCNTCGKTFERPQYYVRYRKDSLFFCSPQCSWGRWKFKRGFREDLQHFFRSSWEANYARILNHQGIQWEYEPTTLVVDNVMYTPDFYLPDKQKYIEVKGRWIKETHKEKFNKFSSLFPIELVDKNSYEQLKKQYHFLEGWE